jgi:hypothetical protein
MTYSSSVNHRSTRVFGEDEASSPTLSNGDSSN